MSTCNILSIIFNTMTVNNIFSDYESEAGDEDEAEGAKGKGQLSQLDDATLRERIATMGKG